MIECRRNFADGGYVGTKLGAAIIHLRSLVIEIVRRCDARLLVIPPLRWIVEHTTA